ncbi:MAG: PIG-L family deacetylase [Akkermansiaceae bacterium]|nr:PIG-L family deacetylase [Akkermansiaceae bacterium]
MSLFIPDSPHQPASLTRVTHLGIGAHHDDLEFMAYHGIVTCYDNPDLWFGGVTCTNGAGSSRIGPFADLTDEQMQEVRHQEQDAAATTGQYAAQYQLGHPSSVIKDPANPTLTNELLTILQVTKPEVVYTHNPADKHPSHLAVTAATIKALRQLDPAVRPRQVLGCEVWRGLDWMADADKILLDVSTNPDLSKTLGAHFASQIVGGKRYDLAVRGRALANATFFDSHSVDAASHVWYAMDLTPLLHDPSLDPVQFTLAHIDKFKADVSQNLGPHFNSWGRNS